jgi:hypothetical protein
LIDKKAKIEPKGQTFFKDKQEIITVFTRLSAAALFKFSELQMWRSFGGRRSIGGGAHSGDGAQSGAALIRGRRSIGGGAQSGAALFKKIFYL